MKYIVGCYTKNIKLVETENLHAARIAVLAIDELFLNMGFKTNPYTIYTKEEWEQNPYALGKL